MRTYSIDDGDGNEITAGVSSLTVYAMAQRFANERAAAVVVYADDDSEIYTVEAETCTFPTRFYVVFETSFRSDQQPCISHETIDKVKTLCGRKVEDAATFEPDSNNLTPDCITCRRKLRALGIVSR